MKNRNEEKSRLLHAADWLVIAVILLFLVAAICEDVAIYRLDKSKQSQNVSMEITVVGIPTERAQKLTEQRPTAEKMQMLYGGNDFGMVWGGFMTGDRRTENGVEVCDLSATLRGVGKGSGDRYEIYGCCAVTPGKELLLTLGDEMFVAKIESVGTVSA